MVISYMEEIDLALAKEIVLSLLKMIIVTIIRDELHPTTIIVEIADRPVKTIDTIVIDVALTIKIDDLTEITLNQDHPTEMKALIITTIDQQAERINFAAIHTIIAAATVAIDHTIDPTVDHHLDQIIFLPTALIIATTEMAAIIVAHHIDKRIIQDLIAEEGKSKIPLLGYAIAVHPSDASIQVSNQDTTVAQTII